MSSRRLWFKLILAGMLAIFVATSLVPALSPPAYAQGVFGNKRTGSDSSQDDEAKKRAEQEAREKAERDKQAQEQAERDRQAREQTERDRQAREQAERDRQAREQAERDRQDREQAERDRQAREQAERDRQQRDQAERDKQAREQAERDRQSQEQAERDRQAREQAERDRQAREQAERDRQAREQAERDRQARERTEREKPANQPASVFNKSGSERDQRVHQPTPPETENRRGDKFTRVEERPKREERHESHTYRPPDYYPYDPDYRHDAPVYIPVPPPPEPIPPAQEPEVIVIDRGPDSHPEPEPPKQEAEEPANVEPLPGPAVEPAPETLPEPEPVTPPKQVKPKRYAQKPTIPQDLKRPARRGSADEALNHISLAWLTGDASLIRRHVRTNYPVRIYQKGRYLHKISGSEFIELTTDALKRMNTREFRLYPISAKNNKVFARGTHVYVGLDARIHRTALNYTLKKIGGVWTIVEVGYSPGTVVEAKAK